MSERERERERERKRERERVRKRQMLSWVTVGFQLLSPTLAPPEVSKITDLKPQNHAAR